MSNELCMFIRKGADLQWQQQREDERKEYENKEKQNIDVTEKRKQT